jgi:hypothetical protein
LPWGSLSTSSILDTAQARFLQIAEDYAWVNPHLTLTLTWNRDGCDPVQWTIPATDPAWSKWRPSDPTSPHWYDASRLSRLIANKIAYAEDHGETCRTVADFVGEFRGLSGTAKAKAICESISASRLSLAKFYADGDGARVKALLSEMQKQSRAVKPRDLGIIGEAHLRAKFESAGAAPESFNYKQCKIECGGVPYFAEAAFGYCPDGIDERRILTGINWSVAIGSNLFGGLDALLTEQRASDDEPIIFVLHLACPRIEYLNRGKMSVALPASSAAPLRGIIKGATEKWAKQRKAEERDDSARLRRDDRLVKYDRPTTFKDAASRVMLQAYMKVSGNNTLPANPRQIMYAARAEILNITGKDHLDSQYFCQTLLPDFIREHSATCAGWDICWDDRGHFSEPHTGKTFGVGTLNVREYVESFASPAFIEAGFAGAGIETNGPEGRYAAVLYIEKEGFTPILEQAHVANRFDIAIMSCKGMSVTAARQLIDKTCARYGIPLLILRDFDTSGFSIAKTLCSDTRRYSYNSSFKTIDLGLRLTDVDDLGLASEPVSFGKVDWNKIRSRLKVNGATVEEIAFLMSRRRVELNAMDSPTFVAFVERKLTEVGVVKVVPPKDQLDKAFRLFARSKQIEETVETAIDDLDDDETTVPDDLEDRVRAYLTQHPSELWENALKAFVEFQ